MVRRAFILIVALGLSACDVSPDASSADSSGTDPSGATDAPASPLPTPKAPEMETVYGVFVCAKWNGECDAEPKDNELYRSLKECQEVAHGAESEDLRAECRAKQQPTREEEMKENGWSSAQ